MSMRLVSMAVRDELAADHQWDSPGKGRFARLRAGGNWIRTLSPPPVGCRFETVACPKKASSTMSSRGGSSPPEPKVRRLTAGGRRIQLAVPPRRERLWGATPGKHRRLGPEPVSGSAFRAAVSDWQRPEEPFAGAGQMVRVRFPPAESHPNSEVAGSRRP